MLDSQCKFWTNYWGVLSVEVVEKKKFEVHGYENISIDNKTKNLANFTQPGTLWGYVQDGSCIIQSEIFNWEVKPLQWFCVPFTKQLELKFSKDSRVFVVFQNEYFGLSSMGGPIEKSGRLRYIDGCTDTILCSPPEIGDPCMNLLHFPPGVDQTSHYHPSLRSGIITRGYGVCVSSQEDSLKPGTIFLLPSRIRHKFRTKDHSMDVISFHPDSDWGPTHEVHPMINRTWGTDGSDQY